MSRWHTGRATAAALSLCLVLASCGNDDPEDAAPPEVPVAGGTFVMGLVQPSYVEPWRAQTVSERIIADQVYDGLTAWHPSSLEAVPALAERWEVSEDRKTWTFHLRRDAVAGNGEAITATDVKTSFQRGVRDPLVGLTGELTAINGLVSYRDNPAVPEVSGIVVDNPTTVRFVLDTPLSDLALLFGNPSFGIEHFDPVGNSVSTGPFVIESRPPGSMALVKRPSSQALLDRVNVTFYPDVNSAYADFDQGKLDFAPVPGDRADEAGSKYGTHLFEPSLRTVYLSFHFAARPGDARFREAIVRTIDRTAVVDKLTPADARTLNGIVPEGVPGAQGGGCLEKCVRDVARAKSLIREVYGDAPPPPVVIDAIAGAPFTDAAAKQVVDDLATAGIPASFRYTAAGSFAQVTVDPSREVFQTSWSAAYPSPEAFLAPLFAAGSRSNVTQLNTAEINQKLAEGQSQKSRDDALETFQELERLVMAQLPVVPIAQFPINAVAKPTVRGLSPFPTGNFDVTSVWLAPPPAP